MKLAYFDLEPGDEPLHAEEYLAIRQRLYELHQAWRALIGAPSGQQQRLSEERQRLYLEFRRRQPYALLARCPYCESPVWQKAGWLYSLEDEFWSLGEWNGYRVYEGSRCAHLFCVDGALHLEGHLPTEVQRLPNQRTEIFMAAEVPFLKPRVLRLPTMRAVISHLPVAGRYTAYPLVYFAEQLPPQREFCVPWASRAYVDQDRRYGPSPDTITGYRSDAQDYELLPWLEQGKLFWLDAADEPHLRQEPAAAFPYLPRPGRRHPYLIRPGGEVIDLPAPIQGDADIEWESMGF